MRAGLLNQAVGSLASWVILIYKAAVRVKPARGSLARQSELAGQASGRAGGGWLDHLMAGPELWGVARPG